MKNNNIDTTYLNDLFFRYAIFTGKRYRRSEKDKFFKVYSKELSNIGFANDKFKLVKQKRTVNMYVGDFNDNDIVLISSYDTPMKVLFDQDIYPLEVNRQQKNAIKTIMTSMVTFTILMILFFIILLGTGLFKGQGSTISYFYAAYLIVFSAGISYLAFGIPKKDNFVYNSANLISIILIAKHLKEDGIGVSIILTDLSSQRNQGIQFAKEYIKDKNLKPVYIDSIGKDELLITKENESIIVACGTMVGNDLVMKNQLKSDTEIEPDLFVEQVHSVIAGLNKK